jgi:ketosteroid isomerase-like protein
MSIEATQELYRQIGACEFPAVLNKLHDDVHFTIGVDPSVHALGGVHRGKERVQSFFERSRDVDDIVELRPTEFAQTDNRVFALGEARRRSGGDSATERFVHVWSFRDEKATHFEEFFHNQSV